MTAEYVDNDVSASKPRGKGTAWNTMIEDATDKRLDVVLAVNLDRLVRSTRDLGTLIDTGAAVTTLEGELDLTSASGELQASILASMARFETRRKAERQIRANEHRRSKGLPVSAGRRSFGYTTVKAGVSPEHAPVRVAADGTEWPDIGHAPIPAEAEAVRAGYALLLSGASLAGIAREWNSRGLTTVGSKNRPGGPWEPTAVRAVLANPKNAGLVAPPRTPGSNLAHHYLGLDDLAVGCWEPLVDVETWTAAKELLSDDARRTTPGPSPRSLLSGIARCGVCGATVKSGGNNGPVYRCSETAHMSRVRPYADEFITHVILDRLARPDFAGALLSQRGGDVGKMREALVVAQQAEANVLALVGAGLTTMRKATGTLRDVRSKIADLEAGITEASRDDVVSEMLTNVRGQDYDTRWTQVAALWEAASADRRRAVVAALLQITLHAPKRGSRPPKDRAGRLSHTESTVELVWIA